MNPSQVYNAWMFLLAFGLIGWIFSKRKKKTPPRFNSVKWPNDN